MNVLYRSDNEILDELATSLLNQSAKNVKVFQENTLEPPQLIDRLLRIITIIVSFNQDNQQESREVVGYAIRIIKKCIFIKPVQYFNVMSQDPAFKDLLSQTLLHVKFELKIKQFSNLFF